MKGFDRQVKAYALLEDIKKIQGVKIVTICTDDSIWKFDISEEGEVGYCKVHSDQCRQLILDCLNTSGSIIIRQFTRMYIWCQGDGVIDNFRIL